MADRKLTILSQNNQFEIEGVDLFRFEPSLVQEMDLPVIGDSFVPGHAYFPLFKYIMETKFTADYYWIIEYDVRFTGIWSVLFDHFQRYDSDLITSHIRSYTEEPEWYWWDLTHPENRSP